MLNWKHSTQKILLAALLPGIWHLASCTTTEPEPFSPLPEIPKYVSVRHPDGFDLQDLKVIFEDEKAPKREDVKSCDADYRELESKTSSKDELERGVRELVAMNPEFYHWCFYSKILDLDDELKQTTLTLKQRQAAVILAYGFLSPFARGFRTEFNDSRYWRWAISHYSKISEVVYYRKLELSPDTTSELVEVQENPFALARRPMDPAQSVLRKYGLGEMKTEILHGPDVYQKLPEDVPVEENREPAQESSAAESLDPSLTTSNGGQEE